MSTILALYSTPSAQVSTLGVLSKLATIANSTRQGCPLSPIIFALVMEPLVVTIRTTSGVESIPDNGLQHKISLLADDVILMLQHIPCL